MGQGIEESGKESSSDVPSYAKGATVRPGESVEDAIRRVMGSRYPSQGDRKGRGPGSEYSQIKKRLIRR